jgi:two-component system KDP operon response regulator KdpE
MTGRPRILVCDDEPRILRALRITLRDEGFDVIATATAAEALDQAALKAPDAAILDLLLPDGSGIDVTRELRGWSRLPIIVLSAVGEEEQKVSALEAGADDYVTKPFSPRELVARLRAVLRRAQATPDEPVLRAGDLELDLARRTVRRGGEDVHLTPTEFRLLTALMTRPGRLLTHAALLTEVWGPAYRDDVATLRTHIANLRRKVEPGEQAERRIRTDAGVGYRSSQTALDAILMPPGRTSMPPARRRPILRACPSSPPCAGRATSAFRSTSPRWSGRSIAPWRRPTGPAAGCAARRRRTTPAFSPRGAS